jgi:uncharacterized protein
MFVHKIRMDEQSSQYWEQYGQFLIAIFDEWVRHDVGRVFVRIFSAQQCKFGQAKRDTLPHTCRECGVRFVCNGGCPKNRLLTTLDGEAGLNHLCAGYRVFFTHIDRPTKMMVEELGARRPPANVMLRIAREDEELQKRFVTARRNDPCPCGSGLKLKRCHMRKGR